MPIVAGPPSAWTAKPEVERTRPRMVRVLDAADVVTMALEPAPVTLIALASMVTGPD
jgi:hypothetical protein